MERWDETWHRLLFWTDSSGKSERLAAQILLSDNYSNLEPSHPLGGPDSKKDATVYRRNKKWVMAAYFATGPKNFKSVLKKAQGDSKGVKLNNAYGLVFITNQELSLTERNKLKKALGVPVDLYHLEKIVAILDQPHLNSLRYQFLGIRGPPNGDEGNHFAPILHIRPKEFAFVQVNELKDAYFEFILPILHHKNLAKSDSLGVLMCHKVTQEFDLDYTVFVSADWLKWYLEGQKHDFSRGIKVPPKFIYGQVPSWPDTFFEFLQAMVNTKTSFTWEMHRDDFLTLTQAPKAQT